MKTNRVERRHGKMRIVVTAGVVLLVAAAVGVVVAYEKLQAMCRETCVITDVSVQAKVTEGKMVKGAAVLDALGIRNGANLAELDFDERRRELLERVPNIKSVSVTRTLPNQVTVVVEERTPIVRMGVHGRRETTGRVADAEGMVFSCRIGTAMLPLVKEAANGVTHVGKRLTGRSLAGLRLIKTAADREYTALGLLEVDVNPTDYIIATLGNYSQAKIAWKGMDEPNDSGLPHLTRNLKHLLQAINSNIGSDAKMWNVTEPDRVYADTREIL